MKHVNTITLILVAATVVFTLIFMFSPASLGIYERGAEYTKYFDSEAVTVVNITISESNWADILENPTAEEFHVADVEINGDVYSGVGIRTKGMTSLSSVASSDSDRYSFKVKADEYVSGQSFAGLDEFVLNNNYQDPTYMKEFLSYELMEEMNVPTPLHSYAAVYINDEYFGLYLMIEAVEEDFAMRNFGSDYGELYKPETMDMGGDMPQNGDTPSMTDIQDFEPQGDFTMPDGFSMTGMPQRQFTMLGDFSMTDMPQNFRPGGEFTMPDMGGGFGGFGFGGGADLVYTDDEISSYNQIFDNAVFDGVKDADKIRVIDSLKALAEGDNLEEFVDVDEVLRYFAANTALVNLDSYVSSLKHNYYLYEEDGRIAILPWDFNLAFGTFQSGDAEGVVNFPIDTPVSEEISLDERPLIGVLLEVETYKEQYHEYLRYIADEFFGTSFADRIDSVDSLICDYVRADPTAFYSYDEYKEGLSAIKTYGELRSESIIGQLEGTIPATHEEQMNSNALVNADSLNIQDLGTMFGGGLGGR